MTTRNRANIGTMLLYAKRIIYINAAASINIRACSAYNDVTNGMLSNEICIRRIDFIVSINITTLMGGRWIRSQSRTSCNIIGLDRRFNRHFNRLRNLYPDRRIAFRKENNNGNDGNDKNDVKEWR